MGREWLGAVWERENERQKPASDQWMSTHLCNVDGDATCGERSLVKNSPPIHPARFPLTPAAACPRGRSVIDSSQLPLPLTLSSLLLTSPRP